MNKKWEKSPKRIEKCSNKLKIESLASIPKTNPSKIVSPFLNWKNQDIPTKRKMMMLKEYMRKRQINTKMSFVN